MTFSTVLADPPWNQKAGPALVRPAGKNPRWTDYGHQGTSRSMGYPTMRVEEIAALPVSLLAATDAHLYLWMD